jgi:hypothetical protein
MTTRRETPTRRRTETPTRRRTDRQDRGKRSERSGPKTTPTRRPAPAASTSQAKARAKARKAKAPKAVRAPVRDRLIARLSSVDLRPQTLAAKVPFVVLVIGSLAAGLALTLWLSTDSAERSYELGNARETNRVLNQQKESLERQVQQAQAAPALAEAARNLGMIPSRDTAHLVQDAAGNWVVVGDPKPAEGSSPPPLNTKLPDPTTTPPVPVDRTEVPVLVLSPPKPALGAAPLGSAGAPGTNPELLVRAPAAPPDPSAVSVPPPQALAAPATPGAQPETPPPAGEPVVGTGPLPGPSVAPLSAPEAPQPANAPTPQAAPEPPTSVATPPVPPT